MREPPLPYRSTTSQPATATGYVTQPKEMVSVAEFMPDMLAAIKDLPPPTGKRNFHR